MLETSIQIALMSYGMLAVIGFVVAFLIKGMSIFLKAK
ncbi:MAG: hypothetical protein A4E54_01346 [Pelotomaculum sp. PtaB.Bin117]|nr:MAG: hypothetical protein A4E54_01346 [Pelotomaculum sp. PtaB.Bin117]OPY62419.1 MAG: hypothetical protein A4E56_01334 [Pelotomaculum sp. PtaU1.Bin065]